LRNPWIVEKHPELLVAARRLCDVTRIKVCLDATAQQGNALTTANAPSASAPDSNNLGANATQEYGAMGDSNALMLSDLGSRAPRFVTNPASQFSPVHSNQTTTHSPSTIPPGINPSTPPSLNTSGISGVTEVGTDLLNDQGMSMSVAGTFIPSLSPRRNTQSPETHQLQQTLRNSRSELVRTCSSLSDSGDGASVFASLKANNTSAVVETVQEGRSDDDEEWLEVNLNPRLLNACNDLSLTYDSGLQELIIDTIDPGHADFALNVGALGNASGTPLDGAQNVSFGESTVDGGCTINGGEGNKAVASSYNCQDPSDPEVIAALMFQRAVVDPRSPSMIPFNEHVTVAEYSPNHSPNALRTLGTAASTSTGNLGGASATGSTQGDPTSLQGDPSSTGSTQGDPTLSQGNPSSS